MVNRSLTVSVIFLAEIFDREKKCDGQKKMLEISLTICYKGKIHMMLLWWV
ncbi:MAG: hypothetical protein V2I97_06210 [Desulfococcaceae bacterium]|nr:hypothetical protein [Desulfococcaceae bacterium]